MWSLPYLLFFLRVSGIQPVTYAASVSASQSIVDAEPRREIDETWDYDYESGDNNIFSDLFVRIIEIFEGPLFFYNLCNGNL